jgi:DNA mismatch repair protein MutS
MLYDDYIEYCIKYKKLYGEKMLVLMEVGSFFEFYAVENETIKEGANMNEICSILNIQSTRKNKSIPECSRSNPFMAGFPSHSLKKFIDMLLLENYTIILIEQITPPPNPKRDVTQIISPATYLDEVSINNYLLCFYVSLGFDRFKKENVYCLSATYLDVTTGETFIFDKDIKGDSILISQEISRILMILSPKEVVYIGNKDQIQFHVSCCFHDHSKNDIKIFQTLSFQNAILKKVYTETGLLSPIEYIDLEQKIDILTNFIYLLNFTYEHSELFIKKLSKPIIIHTPSLLYLSNSSAEHLNIIPKQGQTSSLLQILNTCDTVIGKRYFRECLVNPSNSISIIQERYNEIEKMIIDKNYLLYRPHLKTIKDLQRLFRRIFLKMVQPQEIVFIHTSLQSFKKIQELYQNDMISVDPILEQIEKYWDLEKCFTNEINFYKEGINQEIDDLSEKIKNGHSFFQKIVDDANQTITTLSEPFFKLEKTEEYQIIITKKRYDLYLQKVRNSIFKDQPLSASNKTVLKLTFENMHVKQHDLSSNTNRLKSLVNEQFLKDLDLFFSFSELFQQIISFIGKIDFYCTSAKNSIQFHYTKPTLVMNESSFISAKNVRHPLIEIFQKDIPYIPNDVELNPETCGMLLYGINAAGKSSYMKSVGVNLIMAQAGLFVACDSFQYSPYDSIFTRIPGGDNLFKGQSTFVAEISELRTILKYSTNKSLIIGDEVASGTESVSAISIVSAGISLLSDRKSSFIFATHLHEVAQLESIKKLKNVGIFHISVHYDESKNLLMYDRKLKPGSGETLYGLEVCKSLDMSPEFLHLANMIRQEHLSFSKTIVETKKSRYSSDVFVDKCSICDQKADEIHHIKQQMNADKNGFIKTDMSIIHKNDQHNLIAICEKCHDEIHNGSIIVDGYVQTNKGKVLITDKVENINILESVIELRKNGKSISFIAKELKTTVYQIQKLLKK